MLKQNKISFLISFVLPLIILVPIQMIKQPPMILAERFFANAGWIEILFLLIYNLMLTKIMLQTENIIKWRVRYWLLFSCIFFSQFVLGLLVNSTFLMTGKLHLPIPALIVAGPLFRGGGYFMLILLLSTILLSGSAWCSHLCYIGALDSMFSKQNNSSKTFSQKKTIIIRYSILALTIILALILRVLKVDYLWAAIIAIAFGIIALFTMIFVSRRRGYMFHCTTFCPIGGMVALLSKIFPIRVRINHNCTFCKKCITDCKYDSLTIDNLKNQKAGWNCTLCGDCLSSCKHQAIYFSFWGGQKNVWNIYASIVISLHTIFIALARL